jgi:predicted ATPase
LTLEDLTARLDDRFRLLTGGSRTALPRQQTLRATLDWSWDLLSGGERVLLRRLAVFAGGWTLEAAEAVCGGDGIDTAAVLDLLTGLVHQSLVVLDDGAERYRFLETVRQYAQEHLVASGEAAAVRDRHLHWCLTRVTRNGTALWVAAQGPWLDRLERELDNLRVALGWARDSGQLALGLRLAQALGRFWYLHSYQSEGLRWLETFLAGSSRDERGGWDEDHTVARRRVRAWALSEAGLLAHLQTEPRMAGNLATQSLALFRQLDDREGIADTLGLQAVVARDQGYFTQAVRLLEESARHWHALGRSDDVTGALVDLALTAIQQGDLAQATALVQEVVTRTAHVASDWGAGHIHFLQGQLAWEQGTLAGARRLGEESLALYQHVGDRRGSALALGYLLGQVAREQGDLDRAMALCAESLALGRELGDGGIIGWACLGMGLTAVEQGDLVRAGTALREGLDCFWTRGMRWFVARCLAGLLGVASVRWPRHVRSWGRRAMPPPGPRGRACRWRRSSRRCSRGDPAQAGQHADPRAA